MSLKEYIQFNDDFKYSVNIEYDYDNANKINNYILTRDSVETLKFYFNNLAENKYRANFLIGAYGKGKSNLLLVLLNLLTAYDQKYDTNISNFIEKIKLYDKDLYIQIKKFRETKKRLLPVIINSNYDDLSRSFLYAIKRAIEKFNFVNITFDSYYDVAHKTVLKWEQGNKTAIKLLKDCINKSNKKISIAELKKGLQSYDSNAYKLFLDIYRCVTNGEKFEPLISTDIIKIYKEVLHKIREMDKNYIGLYIVFDEFSKFLEQSKDENIIKDIIFLQNLAEAASRSSDDEQMHLTCITHKPIIEYLELFGETRINAFKTIEGRFKNVYLSKNLLDSYEMISHSYSFSSEKIINIKFKDAGLKEIYDHCIKEDIFVKVTNFNELIKKGCYPINPYVLYSLVNLIEYIGQNDRSIFNFISGDDNFSLKDFIIKKKDEEHILYPLDYLYDYFSIMLKSERNANIVEIYSQIESSLLSVSNNKEILGEEKKIAKKIIKSLGIIYLCRDVDIFEPNKETIQYSLNITKSDIKIFEEFEKAFNDLIKNGLIREIPLSKNFQFSNKKAFLLINKANDLALRYTNFEIDIFLNRVLDNEYELPRKYNDENCINRFFRYVYITKDKLLQLNSFDLLFKQQFQDGIILNVILQKKTDEREVSQYLSKFGNNRMIAIVPKSIISNELVNLCKLYRSYEDLLDDKNSDDIEKKFIAKESEEIKDILTEKIAAYFDHINYKKVVYNKKDQDGEKSINTIVSDACEECFKNTPIINYELINKNHITSQTKKHIGIVFDYIMNNGLLKDNIPESNKTSAENSIYRVFKYYTKENTNNKCDKANSIIKDFLKEHEGERISFKELFDELKKQKVYIRNGVMPLYLAYNLSRYNGNTVLYYKIQEIELNSDNIYKAILNESNYEILIFKSSTQKNDYLNELLSIFGLKTMQNMVTDSKILVDRMKKYFMSLPNIARSANYNNRIIEISDEEIAFKNEIIKDNVNSVDFILENIFEIFNIKKNYETAIKLIRKTKSDYDAYYKACISKIANNLKEILNSKEKNSLKASFDNFLSENKDKIAVNIYKTKTKELLNFMMKNNNYDDEYIVNKIANIYTTMDISDFRGSETDKIFKGFADSLEEIKSSGDKNGNKEIVRISIGAETFEKGIKKDVSKLGDTLKNVLAESIDEYGSSISNQEKVYILLKLIEDII